MKQLYDQREVSRLTGISESQIRYWDRQGLIPHREKARGRLWFDFQSLVAFRTVRDLRRQGVSLHKIRNCLAKLRRIMPGLKQPLAEVRISLVDDQLILGKNRRRFTPEGQLFINFNGGEGAPVTVARESCEELFFQALEDEDAGRMSEAQEKYEQVLAAVPDHVDALVNLGTIHFLGGTKPRRPPATSKPWPSTRTTPKPTTTWPTSWKARGNWMPPSCFTRRPSRWTRSLPTPTSTWPCSRRPWGITAEPGITGGASWNWTRRANGRRLSGGGWRKAEAGRRLGGAGLN